jgi:hypothetical protein
MLDNKAIKLTSININVWNYTCKRSACPKRSEKFELKNMFQVKLQR